MSDAIDPLVDLGPPVEIVNTGSGHDDPATARPGTALCLSGGGYRAMVFHCGALWRLYDAGKLKELKRISSVSGGSITAAVLGLKWKKLSFKPEALRDDFVPYVITPIRDLADTTIDQSSILEGIFSTDTIAEEVADEYEDRLFGGATLQDLPDSPRFVINATNVQSGALWRFSKPYMRDWKVGEIKHPTVRLATAVAASSAFPPVLSPMTLRVDPTSFTPNSGALLQRKPYTSRVVLTDGGVYDNLGLETAWKAFDTILVSDGGGKMQPEEEPKQDWARHAFRVLNLIDNQVRSLRQRQLIGSFQAPQGSPFHRKGTYWGIRTNIANYRLDSALPAPFDRTTDLASTPTRLKRLDEKVQERLINWGYAVCDAALRTHVDAALPAGSFPYPESAI
jgi:NTE family protein